MKLFLLIAFAITARAEVWTTWIEPCPQATAQRTGCHSGDPELAQWALDAWSRSTSILTFQPVISESDARLVFRWVSGSDGLYGETRAFEFHGKRGAIAYILPSTGSGEDPLLRDAILYLTSLHESGHALGLPHTDRFEDIMYSFQYGGDIPEYFGRYRRKLHVRADIRSNSAISLGDQTALVAAIGHPL